MYIFCDSKNFKSTIVVGRGNSNSDVMLIGEAPGATEEKMLKPFVGRSGNVLNNLLGIWKFEIGIKEMLKDINKWKDAPLWTPKKIKNATKMWFSFLKKNETKR